MALDSANMSLSVAGCALATVPELIWWLLVLRAHPRVLAAELLENSEMPELSL